LQLEAASCPCYDAIRRRIQNISGKRPPPTHSQRAAVLVRARKIQ
jgi:hypothetical protein